MSTADWIVIALGLAAIVWVNWYFFLAGQRAERSAAGEGGRGVDNDDRGTRHD